MNKLFIGFCILVAMPVTGRAVQRVLPPEYSALMSEGRPEETYTSSVGRITKYDDGSIKIDNYLGKGGTFYLSSNLAIHVEFDAQGTLVRSSLDREPYVDQSYYKYPDSFGVRKHKDDTLEYYYSFPLSDKVSHSEMMRGLSILYPDKDDTIIRFRRQDMAITVDSVKFSLGDGRFFAVYKAILKGDIQEIDKLLQMLLGLTFDKKYCLLETALEKYLQVRTDEQRENFLTILNWFASILNEHDYTLYIAIKTINPDLVARVLQQYVQSCPSEYLSRFFKTGNTLLTEALIIASGQLTAEQLENIHMIIKQLLAAGARPTADDIKMIVTVPGGSDLLKIFMQASGRAVFDALKSADRAQLDKLLSDIQKRGTIRALNTMTNDAGQTPLVYALVSALDVAGTDADRFQKLLHIAQSLINQGATLDNSAGKKFLNEHKRDYRKKLSRYFVI